MKNWKKSTFLNFLDFATQTSIFLTIRSYHTGFWILLAEEMPHLLSELEIKICSTDCLSSMFFKLWASWGLGRRCPSSLQTSSSCEASICWTPRTGHWLGSPGQWINTLLLFPWSHMRGFVSFNKCFNPGKEWWILVLYVFRIWSISHSTHQIIQVPLFKTNQPLLDSSIWWRHNSNSRSLKMVYTVIIPLSLLVHFHPWSRWGRVSPSRCWCRTASARNCHFQPGKNISSFLEVLQAHLV